MLAYTSDGVFRIAPEHVLLDTRDPIKLSFSDWLKMRKHHSNFKAFHYLLSNNIEIAKLVVLGNNKRGDDKRVAWFIRFSIDGRNTHFRARFGENFLWQIPEESCEAIMRQLREFVEKGVEDDIVDDLLELSYTSHTFDPTDYAGCAKLTEVSNYYDKAFVMSVRPAVSPNREASDSIASIKIKIPPVGGLRPMPPCADNLRERNVRNHCFKLTMLDGSQGPDDPRVPMRIHPSREANLPWNASVEMRLAAGRALAANRPARDHMNADLSHMIMQFAVNDAVTSSTPSFMLSLRMVNRQFRDMVTKASKSMLIRVNELTNESLKATQVPTLLKTRDTVLNHNFVTLHVLSEFKFCTLHSLMRLRTGKRPQDTPNVPGSRKYARLKTERDSFDARRASLTV